jgi:hypothetical protein
MGYAVGDKGLPRNQRRAILRAAFEEDIPTVGSAEYMAQWSQPATPARLEKIANFLAANCQNLKRKGKGTEKAVAEWEDDLRWLKETFYDRLKWPQETYYRDYFDWPTTLV